MPCFLTQEYSSFSLTSMARRELEAGLPRPSYAPPDTVTPDTLTSEAVTPNAPSQDGEPGFSAAERADALERKLQSKLCQLVRRASDKEPSSSEDDRRERRGRGPGETPSGGEREKESDQELEKLAQREEQRLKEKRLERAGERLEKKEGERGEEREISGAMQQQEEEVQGVEESEGDREGTLEQTEQKAVGMGTMYPTQESAPYGQEDVLSPVDVRKVTALSAQRRVHIPCLNPLYMNVNTLGLMSH